MIKKKFWLSLLTMTGIATIPIAVMSANTSNAIVVKKDNSTNKTVKIDEEEYKKLLEEIKKIKNNTQNIVKTQQEDKKEKEEQKEFEWKVGLGFGCVFCFLLFALLIWASTIHR